MQGSIREKLKTVPLAALVATGTNVRKTPAERSAMDELKASILAHGIISSLSVRLEPPGEADRYGVVAGRRRHEALQELADDGKIQMSYPVPCRVLDGEQEMEISLAENVCRVAMQPLEQCDAFVKLLSLGATPEDIAERFGISTRTVEQRLRLTRIAPEVIADYKAGAMDLSTLSAFGNTSDQDRQREMWNRIRNNYHPNAAMVDRLLREQHVPATSSKAKYVGLEAYEAANGRIERNLFGDDEATYLIDVDLLDRLVTEKLQAKANALAKRWKWAEARIEFGWDDEHNLGRVEPIPGEYTEDEQAEVRKLSEEMDSVAERINGGGYAEGETEDGLRESYGTLERKLNALQRKVSRRSHFTPEQRRIAGCHVSLGHDGRCHVTYGLVRPEDVPKPAKGPHKPAAEEDGETHETPPADVVVVGPTGQPYTGTARERQRTKSALEKAGLNQSLGEDLRHVRLAIVRHHLAADPAAALDLLLYAVVGQERRHSHNQTLDASFTETSNVPMGRMGQGRAAFEAESPGIQLLAEVDDLPLAWRNQRSERARYEALKALPQADKMRLLAHLIARTLKPQLSLEEHADAAYEATVARLGIDFATEIRPTRGLFWNRLTKARILEIATEVLGADWAKAQAGKKKGELAQAMEDAFADGGTPDMTAAQKKAAARWTMPGFEAPASTAQPRRAKQPAATKRTAKANGAPKPDGDGAAATNGHGDGAPAVAKESATVPAFLKTGADRAADTAQATS